MNDEFVKRVYQTSVAGNIEIYKDMFDNMTVNGDTIEYWKKARAFYRVLSAEDRQIFFEILMTVMTDTIADIFGIIDGSTALLGGDMEVAMQIEDRDTDSELQDAFLAYVEDLEDQDETDS